MTTHTGSLPRPVDLLPLIAQQEAGASADSPSARAHVKNAVTDIVRKQLETGVDIVNDGEMGKPSYATYVKDRLTGYGGETALLAIRDLAEYPEFAERFMRDGVIETLKRPACTGPVSYRDIEALQRDIDNLKAAVAVRHPAEAFMSAASPGVITIFLGNHYYKSHEEYIGALAEAMKTEYQAIHQAGFILQVDCPDLAMGRHIQFPDATLS